MAVCSLFEHSGRATPAELAAAPACARDRQRIGRSAPAALIALISLIALTAGAALGCERRSRQTPDDTLVMLLDGKIASFDPRFLINNHEEKMSRLLVPGLTSIDRLSLEPLPELAASIEQVGELTWDAVLRPGLRFSDGTPVTAHDVAYTFMSTLDPATRSPQRGGIAERFREVEAVDATRVRFHLVTPVATLLSDLEFGVISAAAAQRARPEVIGAGAYRVVELEPEQRLLLERNPYYAGPPAVMPRIEVRTVRDANARALMLVGGSADLTQNGLRMDLIDAVAERSRIAVDSGPGVILTYLMMQNEDPVLADVRVRRAIAHAIDRERIIAAKLGGRAVLATGMVPPSHWAYEGDVDRYAYDPERARALLDEAGYPDPDGPGGAPRLQLTYKTSADQFRLAIARIIASQLGEVGIAVEVRSFEFGTFFADIKKGNFQIATMQTAPITEPDFLYTYFHSTRIPGPDNPQDHNRWRYRSSRLDELTAAGRKTGDRDRRLALYSEAQQILARDIPIIPLWHEDNVVIRNVDVVDYQILPTARFGGLRVAGKPGR